VRRTSIVLLACALALGCATTPGWFQELLDRETALAPPRPVASADRFFRAEVAAPLAAPVEQVDEAYLVRLDLGTEAPVECSIHPNELDLAASLANFSEAAFSGIATGLGEVEARGVHRVDAGAFDESPYLALDWVYRVNRDGTPLAGQVKHLIATKGTTSVYCQHHEVGYQETFARLVGGLVRSLEVRAQGKAAPYYTEISSITVRGQRIGVERTLLTRDGRDTRIARQSWMLVSADGQTLQTTDSFDVEFADAEGGLINQAHFEASNGELVSELELLPAAGGAWQVNGTYQSKPVQATLRAGDPPASSLGEVLALRSRLEALEPGGALRLMRWIPQADPTRFVQETLTLGEPLGEAGYQAHLSVEGLDADLVVDPRGSVASASLEMGLARLEYERVFVDGEI
jgi:hypothetical protein